ncbi:MAG: hypothetical protein FWF45_02560 [Coriobacteriia bacterium]|nr:hypothetical protein [Coriobacteriia bacterium]
MDLTAVFNLPVKNMGAIDLTGLPRFYETDFDIERIQIGLTDCVIIAPKSIVNLPTITKMVQTLEARVDLPCVISTSKLSDYQKKQFRELNIAYIISPHNLYIPFIGLEIRQAKRQKENITSLSWQAQYTALHIIDGSWLGFSASDIAQEMKRSLPSISNYLKDIEATVSQVVEKQGTKKLLVNNEGLGKGELFQLFEPYLTTPVKDSCFLKFKNKPSNFTDYGCLYAGMSALSRKTMLADNSWVTYACSEYERRYLDKLGNTIFAVAENDNPDILLQIWKYPPINSGDGTVDDVSLYLSLKDAPQLKEPRGEEALIGLRERIAQ